MADPANPRPTLTRDDALPRVEPPTGTFIVQLFVVPAMIVLIIVLVWVLFNWLAHMGSDPRQYLDQIRKQNANSWIAAHNLAEELRTRPELRQDADVARELGVMLVESIETGGSSKDDVQLRVFLCRALGEFRVADGLPALIQAADTQRRDADLDVRRSALEAIALLLSHVREDESHTPIDEDQVLATLLKASRDENPLLREGAAYALGVLGGATANLRLVELLSDGRANVRFNAATGLARQGRPEALEVLIEMLDVANLEGISEEEGAKAQDFKRALVAINGLRAIKQLVDAQPETNTAALKQAVQALCDSDLKASFDQQDYAIEVHSQAKALLQQLQSP